MEGKEQVRENEEDNDEEDLVMKERREGWREEDKDGSKMSQNDMEMWIKYKLGERRRKIREEK